jgi:hypothetical protein
VPRPVQWEYDGSAWRVATGEAPPCDAPILIPPVDLSRPSGVLYPGQTRGGDYKPHGGFRFDGATSNAVDVVASTGGFVFRVGRYIEQGEVQHMVDILDPCGILVRFDHIRTPSPAIAIAFDALPAPQPDDSRTQATQQQLLIGADTPVAIEVGFEGNVSFDYGVYDLRQPNGSAAPPGELTSYAICWLELLPPTVYDLPPADPTAGTSSDYCS